MPQRLSSSTSKTPGAVLRRTRAVTMTRPEQHACFVRWSASTFNRPSVQTAYPTYLRYRRAFRWYPALGRWLGPELSITPGIHDAQPALARHTLVLHGRGRPYMPTIGTLALGDSFSVFPPRHLFGLTYVRLLDRRDLLAKAPSPHISVVRYISHNEIVVTRVA